MDMTKMGCFLQQLRKEHGLTQEQLGEQLHVTGKTISRWETGTYMPPVEMLLAMSEMYRVSMNELVSGGRLTPEEQPAKAEENLTVLMKENAVFQLKERKAFWQEKWLRDHRWAIAALVGVFCSATLLSIVIRRTDLTAALCLIAVGLTVFLRNRCDSYLDHHLYDDMLE